MADDSRHRFAAQSGTVLTRVEKWQSVSGQLFEIRYSEMSIMENGILKKESFFEVFPPLLDNRIPDSIGDVRECICGGLYHKENVSKCSYCGRDFALCCRKEIETEKGTERICISCADERSLSFMDKLFKKFWTMKE